MLDPDVVDQIKRLLGEGNLSQRSIARQIGVSRGTVHAIARGKRNDSPPRKREPDDDFMLPRGPWHRCPTCGGMVQMPCLACRLRAMREDRRRSAGVASSKFPGEPRSLRPRRRGPATRIRCGIPPTDG